MSILMSDSGEEKPACPPNPSEVKSPVEEIKASPVVARNSFSIASILSRDDPKKEIQILPNEVSSCLTRHNFQNLGFEPRLALMRHAQNLCTHQQQTYIKHMYPHYPWNSVSSNDENRNSSGKFFLVLFFKNLKAFRSKTSLGDTIQNQIFNF